MVPAPYSVRWTSKLIRRDLKHIATRCTNTVKKLFSSTPKHDAQLEDEDAFPIDAESFYDDASTNAFTIASTDASLTNPTTESEIITSVEASEANLNTSSTFYERLSTNLEELYACRERDPPHHDRWMFRGAWLILQLATQFCASSPSSKIFPPGSSQDETALLLDILQYMSASTPLDCPTSRNDQMPTMSHTKRNETSLRHDSIFSTVSIQIPPLAPAALLWYFVVAGASDRTKTVRAAECLISHLWAEKDAITMLEEAGNPAKRLCEDDETELRSRFGRMMSPARHAFDEGR